MNTADRSIGHIDYAVRRRFAFDQLLPDEEIDNFYQDATEEKAKTGLIAKQLFKAVSKIFNNREKGGYLSPEFHKDDVQIGHTYFMADTIDELINKFIYQVYPILREYFKDSVLVREVSIQIEGCNEIPVYEAQSVNKLLEQFSANEYLKAIE